MNRRLLWSFWSQSSLCISLTYYYRWGFLKPSAWSPPSWCKDLRRFSSTRTLALQLAGVKIFLSLSLFSIKPTTFSHWQQLLEIPGFQEALQVYHEYQIVKKYDPHWTDDEPGDEGANADAGFWKRVLLECASGWCAKVSFNHWCHQLFWKDHQALFVSSDRCQAWHYYFPN